MNSYIGAGIGVFVVFVIGMGFYVNQLITLHIETPTNGLVASAACSAPLPRIEAKAAYVFDLNKGRVLYQKNETAQVPLASLTKIMTVLIASRVLNPNEFITITPEALTPEGDSGFTVGELWKVQDLIDFTLITSSNDGAHALALATTNSKGEPFDTFVQRMNTLAGQLNLRQTYFLNDTGLDVSEKTAGAYGSARDFAHLLVEVYERDRDTFSASNIPKKTITSVSGKFYDAIHTSAISGELPGWILAKTGFTDLAGGNLAVIAEPIVGHPVALVVLASGKEGRDKDLTTLFRFVQNNIKRDTLCTNTRINQ